MNVFRPTLNEKLTLWFIYPLKFFIQSYHMISSFRILGLIVCIFLFAFNIPSIIQYALAFEFQAFHEKQGFHKYMYNL